MRLNRFLASAGLGSRRSCEDLITSGLVSINGRVVTGLATQVNSGDSVKVRGRVVCPAESLTVLLNKPKGYVVTRADELERRTIYDLVPSEFSRLSHVGRLDKDSEGLLLLTNDGELSQRLAHPRHTVDKEYEVLLDKPFDPAHIARLERGFHIEGGRGRFERVAILSPSAIRVVLRQGLKRQIRLMLYETGYEVKRLKRVRIGPLNDHRLPVGACRLLTRKELDLLRRAATPDVTARRSAPAREPAGR